MGSSCMAGRRRRLTPSRLDETFEAGGRLPAPEARGLAVAAFRRMGRAQVGSDGMTPKVTSLDRRAQRPAASGRRA